MLWDENQIPSGNSYFGEHPLALPKLNLQYLTIHDFLLRNFQLYRLESAFEIREDLVDAIKRMGPRETLGGDITFAGWSRMAVQTQSVAIIEVGKPSLGEVTPSHVHCAVEIDLSKFTGSVRAEWDTLKDHDVLFLVCIEKPTAAATSSLDQFERERLLLSQGMAPRSTRDFEWDSDCLNFPSIYGMRFFIYCSNPQNSLWLRLLETIAVLIDNDAKKCISLLHFYYLLFAAYFHERLRLNNFSRYLRRCQVCSWWRNLRNANGK